MNIESSPIVPLAPASAAPKITVSVGAQLSFLTAGTFLALLAALHVLKPGLSPSWRMISEYSIGEYGWVMRGAFLALALSCIGCVAAIWPQVATRSGQIGLICLTLTGIALAVARAFISDPITVAEDQATTHGYIHGIAAMIGIPALSIAPVLVTRGLAANSRWSVVRWQLLLTAHLTWLSLLLMLGVVAATLPQHGGKFSAAVPIGWPNRLLVIVFCLWLALVARHAMRLRREDLWNAD